MQKVLILWLLLLLSEINCPPSLTQEFCILCSILKTVSGSLVRLQIGKMLDTSQCTAVFFYKERGRGEREREGERETFRGCLLHAPGPGIKPANVGCMGRCSNQPSHPAPPARAVYRHSPHLEREFYGSLPLST